MNRSIKEMPYLRELIELSRTIGAKVPIWTQGAGGNVSSKSEGHLWIKASGTRLDQVSENSGLCCLHRKNFELGLKKCMELSDSEVEPFYESLLRDPMIHISGKGRPSMEAAFHAMLPSKFICHFHSLTSLLISLEHSNFPGAVEKWISDTCDLKFSFIDFATPGISLAMDVARHVGSKIIFLKNHGVILAIDDPMELLDWEQLEDAYIHSRGHHLLSEIKNTREMNEIVKTLNPTEFKILFPDVAVFKDQLLLALSEEDGHYTQLSNEPIVGNNLGELWFALQILLNIFPDFPEIPNNLQDKIVGLPTERYRKERV